MRRQGPSFGPLHGTSTSPPSGQERPVSAQGGQGLDKKTHNDNPKRQQLVCRAAEEADMGRLLSEVVSKAMLRR